MNHDWKQLHAQRPRRPFVTWSLRLFGLMVMISWLVGDFHLSGFLDVQRLSNLQRFLQDIRPWPLRDAAWDHGVAWNWAWSLWQDRGQDASVSTLALSLAAIVNKICIYSF